MPNHVINEVIFTDCESRIEDQIRSLAAGPDTVLDFNTLLPIPINYWMGNVGSVHKETFPGNALDWCKENWSTKWNAYGQPTIKRRDGDLVLTFKTAWGPPTGWLCALFNTLHVDFTHSYLSEGGWGAKTCEWRFPAMTGVGGPMLWRAEDATPEMQKHLHLLLWGVEERLEEDEVEAEGA